jgi:hypothetical protein
MEQSDAARIANCQSNPIGIRPKIT